MTSNVFASVCYETHETVKHMTYSALLYFVQLLNKELYNINVGVFLPSLRFNTLFYLKKIIITIFFFLSLRIRQIILCVSPKTLSPLTPFSSVLNPSICGITCTLAFGKSVVNMFRTGLEVSTVV